MRRRLPATYAYRTLVALGLFCCSLPLAKAQEEPSADELVRALGSSIYAEREAAAERLVSLGHHRISLPAR